MKSFFIKKDATVEFYFILSGTKYSKGLLRNLGSSKNILNSRLHCNQMHCIYTSRDQHYLRRVSAVDEYTVRRNMHSMHATFVKSVNYYAELGGRLYRPT